MWMIFFMITMSIII